MRHGKTRFQDRWLSDPEVSGWIKRCPTDASAAICKFCPGQVISVATMGRQALISHMKGQKHKLKVEAHNKQPSVGAFMSITSSNVGLQPSSSAIGNKSVENTPSTSAIVHIHNPENKASSVDITEVRRPTSKSVMANFTLTS